jgi:hypothetical protein
MKFDPVIYGDPEKTPFVRFDAGTPSYPPNCIYESAQKVIGQIDRTDVADICDSLVQMTSLGGQHVVSPQTTWFAILRAFFKYRGDETTAPNSQLRSREALEIMVELPNETAWNNLKTFVKNDIDNLSGWSRSWRRASAERDQIVRGEDGNYYAKHDAGTLVRVIGAKSIGETRLDFITDQLVHSYGFLHQFVALFALFAIADDYSRKPEKYYKSMKAVLPSDFHRISHHWHFMFNDRTRTISWRPNSNLCDPNWLVADLMAEITDTLQVDYWRKRLDMIRHDETWNESDCPYQCDYVLDSGVRLGSGDECLLEFEGKKFRWFNGTAERNAIVSMGVKDLSNHSDEDDKLNRLLTAIVWNHKIPIIKEWGTGGPRRPFPTAYGPRQSSGIQIDAAFLQYELRQTRTTKQWFALSLFREGINSRSKFYSFLCFWKVIEWAYPKQAARSDWLVKVASKATHEKQRLSQILQGTSDLEKYLRDERRHAVANVFQENRPGSKTTNRPVNPDDPKHEGIVRDDLPVMEDFARIAIEEMLR